MSDSDSSSCSSNSREPEDYLQTEVLLCAPIPDVDSEAMILIVGDSRTGKSLLAQSFTPYPRWPARRYTRTVITESSSQKLGLHILCAPFRRGDKDCFHRKPLDWSPYGAVIFLFDVNKRKTFTSIREKWFLEVCHYLRNDMPPYLLVGNKIDLMPDHGNYSQFPNTYDSPKVYYDECNQLSEKMKAYRYVEVSALCQNNVQHLLNLTISLAKNKYRTTIYP